MKPADNLITVLSNSNGHLIAQQRPPGDSITHFFVILLLGFAVYCIWIRAWKLLFLPGVLLIVFLFPSGQRNTLQVDIDQQTGEIVCSESDKGKVISSTTVTASELTAAEMQFNRGARRIVLIHRDGHQTFPLGEAELQGEPDQYVILNALRQVIGQAPVAPQ